MPSLEQRYASGVKLPDYFTICASSNDEEGIESGLVSNTQITSS